MNLLWSFIQFSNISLIKSSSMNILLAFVLLLIPFLMKSFIEFLYSEGNSFSGIQIIIFYVGSNLFANFLSVHSTWIS